MNGNKLIIQYGLESAYGTIGTATKQIQVASEGFKLNLNKKDEGLLTGSKIGGKKVTVSRKGEGALSTLARPDDIGLFLACALGNESSSLVEGSTGAYAHTFTLTDNDILDSLFFKVKRDASIIKGYTGVSFDGFSLDSQTEDFMKLDLTLLGKDEVNTTLESGLSLSPLSPFRLASSVIKIDDEAIEVLSNKFDFKNGLSASQTNLSGMYFKQPMVGVREITNEVSVFYNSAIESILDLYYRNDAVISHEIKFYNGQDIETGYPYSLTITLPSCQLNGDLPNVSGSEEIKTSLKLQAVENGLEPITVTLVNGFNGSYLS